MKKRLHIRVKTIQFLITLTTFLIIAFQGFAQYPPVNYDESFDDFMNPDRGFYFPYDSEPWTSPTGFYKSLDETLLNDRRTGAPFTPPEQDVQDANYNDSKLYANYSVNTSVILRHWVLDDFKTDPNDTSNVKSISPTFLAKIRNDLEIARRANVRVIMRFSYILQPNFGDCNHGICPPYGDSNESTVIRHIEDLTGIFNDFEDVIMVVQSGFIGIWGEQYYTDYFGDASGQTNGQGYLTTDHWNARIRVLKKLLDAVPASRMVQVRYPQMLQKYLRQHPGDASRIGFQNDCFLSSADDVGTYSDYDNNGSLSRDVLRDYADNIGDFVAVGGETCGSNKDLSAAVSYNRNNCESVGGGAITEMETMNWSFLNCAYSYLVNNDWEDQGCMYDVKTRLGYRFVLESGEYPVVHQTGTNVYFNLSLENKGFAAPFNKRQLYMILKNTSNNTEIAAKIEGEGSDITKWKSGRHNLTLNFELPDNIAEGDYSMHLHIADLSNGGTIRNNPAYSIRLANKFNGTDIWEASTGYNNLHHTIGIQVLQPPPPPPPDNNCIDIDGNFGDWQDIVDLTSTNSSELSSMKVADDGDYIYIHLSGTLKDHYQIFLDTDGDAYRGDIDDSEYLSSHWYGHGFNYMIENGTVFQYYSPNSSAWAWDEMTSISQFEASNGLELVVPKNLFNNLSNSQIRIGAKTLDAAWNGSAYLPTRERWGSVYEPFSSSPCVEPDVCILIDGDGSDWQNVNTTHFNSGSSINELKITENSQYLFVYIKSNVNTSNHTPQIFFDVYDDQNGFRGTDWENNGFDYMMEYNTFHYYNGDGYSWGTWPELGTIERNYDGGNILEFKIPKYMFHESPASTTIKVAGYYKDSNWGHVNKLLPSSGATGINYTLNSNNSCSGLVQKTESNNIVGTNTKYNLESSQTLKNDENSQKKDSQNCITVDGSPNEWSAMGTYGYAATGSLTHVKVADNQDEILFYLEGGLDVNNQIYLNSDVNNATLNRYNLSQWQYTGFNYLIENDLLFLYDGDGDSWSWSQIGTVSHSISENVLEVVVQKSQLTNLSGSIGFAATSLNDDYNETGAIPQSNAALNYLIGTKDLCNIKPTCLNVNGNLDQWLNINDAAQLTNSDHLQSIKISDGSESLYILLEGKMDVHQSVFIDTDNDAVGANEYTDSNWSLTGFNYLIDEGDLFIYQGDGTSWDWEPIGAVNMITSKYWTELSVKKYLMGNITGDIQVAASSFDADWAETSFIPAAEEATAYTPSTNNLSLFFHQNGINFHQAFNVIESSANLINSNTNEVYKAGQSIQLNNGFSSPPVTNFSAYIEECE